MKKAAKERKHLLLLITLLLFIGCSTSKKSMLVKTIYNKEWKMLFAHRGVITAHPENSDGAINAAKKKGFRAIEVDIQESSDGDLIIFHDENAKRLLGIDSNINEMRTSQIKKYPILFNNKKSKSYVLTLDEFLKKYKNDFVFYFDVKLSSLNVFDKLVDGIKKNKIEESSIIATSYIRCIFHIELNNPNVNTALEGFNAGKEWMYYLIPQNMKPDFYSSVYTTVTSKHINWLEKNDLLQRRIVYGIDSTNYQHAIDAGLKNIIVDYFVPLKNIH